MICSSAGISALTAVEAETLGALVFDVEKFLETLGFYEFVKIASLPFSVNSIDLSGPSMRSWIQTFSSGLEMCMNSTPSVEQ